MRKTAKRIAAKVCRYLALVNLVVPAGDKDELERIILDELKESQRRDSMLGRDEGDV